ncbi:MAG TPA: DUF6518 family protein [Galbitalea sp.]|jgi:hypothetical protein|nr:DUF6518 family protein [Galbitalea sp.]
MTSAGTSTASGTAPSAPFVRALGAILLVLGAAAATGTLTPFGESHLPGPINAAANSSGPWAIVAFASVYFSRARGAFAAALGAASFVTMDLLFFVVFDARGGYYPHAYLAFWIVIALLIGPLVGVCASWLRAPRMWLRAVAIAAPSSVLIGEGIFMLVRLPGVSTVYALASVVVGLALFTMLAALLLRGARCLALSTVACVLASAAFLTVYGLLPLILHKVVP